MLSRIWFRASSSFCISSFSVQLSQLPLSIFRLRRCGIVVRHHRWSKELSGIRVRRRENEHQSFSDGKEGEATEWKLFHQEKRPALKRHVIDTSWRAYYGHQYVLRRHFWILAYTSEVGELAAMPLLVVAASRSVVTNFISGFCGSRPWRSIPVPAPAPWGRARSATH